MPVHIAFPIDYQTIEHGSDREALHLAQVVRLALREGARPVAR